MIKKIFNYLLIILVSIIISPLISFGQEADLPPDATGLEMTMTPENPEPFQLVNISLKSYSFDLDRSKITWSVDGVVKKTEQGLKDFSTTAGKNGQGTVIKATVVTQNDGTKEMEAFFIPSVVDLIYKSLSYAPPFYKGKALNPSQGVVLVAAMPELIKTNGEKIPVQNIIYYWKKDGIVQQNASGLGKNTFTYTGTIPIRDVVIEVIASSPDNTIYASKKIEITNTDPKIIFYENSPVYGIMMNRAIKNSVNMLVDEFSTLAMPYFFSVGYATTPDLDYVWNMNGKVIENQDPKNSFTSRLEKASSGIADIGLKITNNVRIFQLTDNKYSINFSKE